MNLKVCIEEESSPPRRSWKEKNPILQLWVRKNYSKAQPCKKNIIIICKYNVWFFLIRTNLLFLIRVVFLKGRFLEGKIASPPPRSDRIFSFRNGLTFGQKGGGRDTYMSHQKNWTMHTWRGSFCLAGADRSATLDAVYHNKIKQKTLWNSQQYNYIPSFGKLPFCPFRSTNLLLLARSKKLFFCYNF